MEKYLRIYYRLIKQYYSDIYESWNSPIKLFNFPKNGICRTDYWLKEFIINRGLLKDYPKKQISIFSVHGYKIAININQSKYKILYIDENVHFQGSHWQQYKGFGDIPYLNLTLGFDYFDDEKYMRFPFWLLTNFNPNSDYESIKTVCNQLNKPTIDFSHKNKFCSLICRSDYYNKRELFFNTINQLGKIDCDGYFLRNNNILKTKFHDNKREFLKLYKFNLCPENSNNKGYVTEKIFDAIHSGCIPIYWGSDNHPEPEILNHDSILFINDIGNNDNLIQKVEELNENSTMYKEFALQNRLNPNASGIIYEYYINLEKKIKYILRNN